MCIDIDKDIDIYQSQIFENIQVISMFKGLSNVFGGTSLYLTSFCFISDII